jgi:O-antigen/teichoic acid export membrane protein
VRNILKSLRTEGSFVQNFSIVFGGKSVIFLIGFVFTPIIARIYSQEAYGSFALYNAIVMNLSILLGMRIPSAFVNIQSNQKFRRTIQSLFGFVLIGIALICIAFILFDSWIFSSVKNKSLIGSWHFIGLGTLLYIMTDIFGNWNVREKAFKKSTTVAVSETLSTKISTSGIGLLGLNMHFGLIIGELIGKTAHILIQIPLFVRKRVHYLIPNFSIKQFQWLVSEFREYPIYLLPSTWISQFTNSATIFYLSYLFSAELVGSYSMSIGLVAIPVMLVAYAGQPILMQKVVQLKEQNLAIEPYIYRFITTLVAVSIPILFFGMVFGELIINKFLGENWGETAVFVSWMIPIIGVQFIMLSLTGVLIGLRKNEVVLIANSIRFISMILIFVISSNLTVDFIETIKIVLLGTLASYIIPLIFIFKRINISVDMRLITLMIVYTFGAVFGYFYTGYF